jgi:hypothetical protein
MPISQRRLRRTTRRSAGQGREGRPSTATLLWTFADVKSREFLIDHVRADDARRSRVAIAPEERERRRALEHAKLPDDRVGRHRRLPAHDHPPVFRESGGAGAMWGLRARAIVASRSARPVACSSGRSSGIARAPRLIEKWIESACAAGLIALSADQYHTLTLMPFGRDVMAARAGGRADAGAQGCRAGPAHARGAGCLAGRGDKPRIVSATVATSRSPRKSTGSS